MECCRIIGVQSDCGSGQPGCGGGFAAGAGSDDHDGRQLLEIPFQHSVDEPRDVLLHTDKSRLNESYSRFST